MSEANSPLPQVLDGLILDRGGTSGPGRGAGRRIAWTVVDQAFSSASNLVTGIVAARSLDRQAFGAFGLAFTLYVLGTGACRGAVTEPLLSLYSRATPAALRPTLREATGSATAMGVALALLALSASAILGGEAGLSLLALALVFPGLVLQDSWRYCFVTAGRPRSAVVNDATWCVVQAVLLVALVMAGHLTLFVIILWWGGSGAVAAVLGCFQSGIIPAPWSLWKWLSLHRHLSGRYVTEYVAAAGASQLGLLGLGMIAGLAALGAIRGAQVYFGPIAVLFGGIYLALAAEGARLRSEPIKLRRLMAAASVILGLLGVGWVMLGAALPAAVGRRIFGDTWVTARAVLVPMGISLLGGCAASGAIVGLRALAAARESLRARLTCLPIVIVVPLFGALAGAHGFAVGMAIATWAGAGVWWRQFNLALQRSVNSTVRTVPAPR